MLRLDGEIDMATAGYFRQELEAAQGDAPKRIVIDLEGVSFIDSTGLSVLMSAGEHAAKNRYELLLQRPSSQTLKLFEVAAVGSYFNVID